MRRLTEEELARAVRIDPSQIRGLGPSLEALMEMLRQRKKKILETYETGRVQNEARQNFHRSSPSERSRPPNWPSHFTKRSGTSRSPTWKNSGTAAATSAASLPASFCI